MGFAAVFIPLFDGWLFRILRPSGLNVHHKFRSLARPVGHPESTRGCWDGDVWQQEIRRMVAFPRCYVETSSPRMPGPSTALAGTDAITVPAATSPNRHH